MAWSMGKFHHQRVKAFTLIESLVFIAVMTILVGVLSDLGRIDEVSDPVTTAHGSGVVASVAFEGPDLRAHEGARVVVIDAEVRLADGRVLPGLVYSAPQSTGSGWSGGRLLLGPDDFGLPLGDNPEQQGPTQFAAPIGINSLVSEPLSEAVSELQSGPSLGEIQSSCLLENFAQMIRLDDVPTFLGYQHSIYPELVVLVTPGEHGLALECLYYGQQMQDTFEYQTQIQIMGLQDKQKLEGAVIRINFAIEGLQNPLASFSNLPSEVEDLLGALPGEQWTVSAEFSGLGVVVGNTADGDRKSQGKLVSMGSSGVNGGACGAQRLSGSLDALFVFAAGILFVLWRRRRALSLTRY